ncbi:MAG: CPBP family intramembrane glutamate endopeptidase, partial [Gammaproteobacteria bacterium]
MTLTQTITIKKGLLALAVMYACQLLAGIFVSVVINTDKTMSMEILGLLSALIGGSLILLLFWLDTKKNAELVTESSGLPFNKAISLVLV